MSQITIPLGENLKAALADCGLNEHRLVCYTTDNGANIAAAIRNWLNCFGHSLQLAVSHNLHQHNLISNTGE